MEKKIQGSGEGQRTMTTDADRQAQLEKELESLRQKIAQMEEQRRALERQLAEARAEAQMIPPTSEEELTRTLKRMFSQFARLLQAEACFFFVHRTDEDNLILHPPTIGIDMTTLGALGAVPPDGIIRHVFQQRVPVSLQSLEETVYPDARILREVGIRNCIIVPLMWDKRDEEQRVVERKAIGVLVVANKRRGQAFTEEDRRIMEILARQSASVVAGAQIYIELRERKEQLERAFESVVAGVILLNINGKIGLINHTALHAFCRPLDGEPTGRYYHEIISHEKVRDILAQALKTRAEIVDEVEIYEPEEHIYRVQTGVVRDEAGHPTGIVALFTDITEIRRVERMKTEFVATVSHELRTPLTAIKGFIATLLEDRESYFDPETRFEFYQIIDQETDRLRRLIEDLLNLSRIERGLSLQPNWVRVDLATVIERVLAVQKSYTEKHRLVSDIPAPLPIIVADEDKMDGVLTNLVNNAIKYSPNGGDVVVRVIRENNSLLISVSDQGIGIPKEKLQRIFEKFERVDTKETRAAGGTGIGLYLVKHLVEAHGGQIWAESEGPGKGSTFYVRLPIYPPKAKEDGFFFHDVEEQLH
ncbi:MAG: ATP-binding protein [Armatimonadetes bacterium]|nr:ATP-binding protein [Armatimonadota bacterium]MDW8122339.1 ATP-binding protein [Armatimonadota bacterium]